MPILITCSSHRDVLRGPLAADAYRGLLPSYTDLVLSDDPAVAFIDAARLGLHLRSHQHGDFLSPSYSSQGDWSRRVDGTRCTLQFTTERPGFFIEWTLEIVAAERVFTAERVADSSVEVYRRDTIDQPIMTVPLSTARRADAALRMHGFHRASDWHEDTAPRRVVVCTEG